MRTEGLLKKLLSYATLLFKWAIQPGTRCANFRLSLLISSTPYCFDTYCFFKCIQKYIYNVYKLDSVLNPCLSEIFEFSKNITAQKFSKIFDDWANSFELNQKRYSSCITQVWLTVTKMVSSIQPRPNGSEFVVQRYLEFYQEKLTACLYEQYYPFIPIPILWSGVWVGKGVCRGNILKCVKVLKVFFVRICN